MASRKKGSTDCSQGMTPSASNAPVPLVVVMRPLIMRNFERKPERGGIPARDSMKTNMEVAMMGSLRASPCKSDILFPPPSISIRVRTRKAPSLNRTKTARWKTIAI